jgi:hypothetical protein
MKIIKARTIWCTEHDPSKTKKPSDKVYSVHLTQDDAGVYKVTTQWGGRGKHQSFCKKPLYEGRSLGLAENAFSEQIRTKQRKSGYDKEQHPLFPSFFPKQAIAEYFGSLMPHDPYYKELEGMGVIRRHDGARIEAIMTMGGESGGQPEYADGLEALYAQFYQ